MGRRCRKYSAIIAAGDALQSYCPQSKQTKKANHTGLPFNLYIDPLFNLHEWIALACYEAIEVSYAALIWLLFLAMGDIEVVIAE